MDKRYRNTKQKQNILRALSQEGRDYFSADDLAQLLREQGAVVGRATIYRYLKQLENDGAIKRYALADPAGACYQYVGENSLCNEHFHLMCGGCGIIEHMHSEHIRSFISDALAGCGFEVDPAKIVFYGTCKSCRNDEV